MHYNMVKMVCARAARSRGTARRHSAEPHAGGHGDAPGARRHRRRPMI